VGRDCGLANYSRIIVKMKWLGSVLVCLLVAGDCYGAITVEDDLMNKVELEEPAQRIISLAPHLTEILFSLEVGDLIEGTSRFSDYPDAAREIPVVGDAFTVSVEAVVELQPDIIFAWSTGGANRSLERLKRLGYPIYMNEARTLKDIGRTVQAMAKLVGRSGKGEELQKQSDEKIASLREMYKSRETVSVFFQISDQNLYSINGEHLISQGIDVCNGKNIFSDSKISVPLVSKESVLALDPDFIVISKPEDGSESVWKEQWGQYEGFDDKLRWIDPGLISRPSLRMLDGIERLCELIHE
jgi:iron complex transport system substrate-binding protein